MATATLGPSTPGLFWGPQAACGAGPGANAIAVADFNGDGYPDYAVVESVQGEVLIYVYQPILGCYKETASFTTTNSSPSGVVVADLNSDGIPDLVVPNSGLDTMEILLGHGDGTFSESTITTGAYTTKAVVGDFNGDGIPDLALCCSNDGITIYLGNGDGTFTKGSSTAANASSTTLERF